MTTRPISFDPGLVEEAVLLAESALSREERRLFRSERDRLYGPERDPDLVESRFRSFHFAWFSRLGLGDPVAGLVEEIPPLYSRCAVMRTAGSAGEGADLHEDREGAPLPALVIRLLPRTLIEPGRLEPLLRRELMHVSDMLDPVFGYRPDATPQPVDAVREKLVRERYRVAWDTSVDGRLSAAGCLPASFREARRGEFLAAFGSLGPRVAGESFERVFGGPRPTHGEMWVLACSAGVPDPEASRVPSGG